MKTTHIRLAILAILLASFSLQSCVGDKFDVKEKLSKKVQWSPELAVPLAHADLTLSDFIREKQDTIQYIPETDLGYGSNSEDLVIQLRYAIDTGRSIDITRLPIMDPYDTTIRLDPVKLSDISAPIGITMNELLQDNFNGADYTTYQAYETASPTITTEHSAIKSTIYTAALPLPVLEYAILSEGQMKLTMGNGFTFPIMCEMTIYTDSLGTDVEIGTFDFSNGGTTWLDPFSQKADSIQFDSTYLGSIIKYEYKNVKFGASTLPVPISLSDYLVTQIDVTDIVASEGRAMIPLQTIKMDSLFYIGLHDSDPSKKLYGVEIEKGAVHYKITSSIEIATDFFIEFPSMEFNGDTVTKFAELNSSTPIVEENWDLADHKLSLRENPDIPFNQLPIRIGYKVYTGNNMVSFGPNQNLNVQFSNPDSIVFSYIEGNFGQISEDVFADNLEFDIGDFIDNFSEGEITFYDPKLRVVYDNPVGIAGSFELNLIGTNSKNQVVDVFSGHDNKFNIKAPSCDSVRMGESITSVIELNKSTSNIVDFIKILPNNIEYSGTFNINDNVADPDNIVNCVSNISDAHLTVEAELPMKLSVKDLVVSQEIPMTDILKSIESVENIENLHLYFYTENMFPLDVTLKITMLDTTLTNPELGDLDMYILQSANTVGGKVPRTSVNKHTAELDLNSNTGDKKLTKLLQANKLRLSVYLETDQQGEVPVVLYTYYGLKFWMSVEGKFLYKGEL